MPVFPPVYYEGLVLALSQCYYIEKSSAERQGIFFVRPDGFDSAQPAGAIIQFSGIYNPPKPLPSNPLPPKSQIRILKSQTFHYLYLNKCPIT